MGKQYKIALMLLYVLQILVVFKDSIAGAYKYAADAIYTQNQVQSVSTIVPTNVDSINYDQHILMARRSFAGLYLFGFMLSDEVQPDHHETEERYRHKGKRRIREYRITNLWLRIKKIVPTAEREISPDRWMRRRMVFPAT